MQFLPWLFLAVASNVPELKKEILKVIIIIIIIIIKVFSYKINAIVIIYKSKTLLHFVVVSLTLRRLMSYIYMEHPFLMFLDHTQRRSTVGRTPLDE